MKENNKKERRTVPQSSWSVVKSSFSTEMRQVVLLSKNLLD